MRPAPVDRNSVIAFRLRAQHLHHRLPGTSLHRAVLCGLPDGAPRSALLSLHARAAGVHADTWADSAFTQVWGPRGAVYLVPVADVAVFTLGLLPRDERKQRAAQEAADAVRAAVGRRQVRKRDVLAAVGDRVDRLILACATGRIRIRWDGRDTLVSAATPPRTDPERARVELLRRFLGALGPSTAEGFAAWTGLSVTDARATVAALSAELTEVTVAHGTRLVLRADHDRLVGAREVAGVRLLPPGDPFLLGADRELLVPAAAHRRAVWPAGTVQPGALLADGELLGTWRRRGHRVEISPWAEVDERVRTAAEREAAGFPLDLARDVTVSWARV
ncbi:winged helix DNA-binding domain-containing protein [Micromonospora sp. PLK6-60]|uniref:DNA glycosylase AlkZ-like family protein n=1 Tax=Micromonospora sp. PLK6-60 TaxID=2873383 RepID=UPI001CA72D2F|nr:crosslink repair DNA glycosylase YcaQ family protein [Micromonospora sp. PLK6-60]MBY8870603.1 winged helix DNA-binding domain-containing protein [Micromonospora sp. PLK6-60]